MTAAELASSGGVWTVGLSSNTPKARSESQAVVARYGMARQWRDGCGHYQVFRRWNTPSGQVSSLLIGGRLPLRRGNEWPSSRPVGEAGHVSFSGSQGLTRPRVSHMVIGALTATTDGYPKVHHHGSAVAGDVQAPNEER
jgi:hypothetical protein